MKRIPINSKRTKPRRKGPKAARIKPGRVEDPGHLKGVRSLPCCVCGARPVEVHHIRDGQGMGQRASDRETLPLCPAHHRTGPDAFHAGPRAFEVKFGTEQYLLAQTLQALAIHDWVEAQDAEVAKDFYGAKP